MDKISQEVAVNPEVTTIFMFTIFLLIVAIGIVMLVLVYQKKQVQFLRDKENLRVIFDKEILSSKLEIQEQTFKNISQEIHDNIGQILSLAKMTINTMDFTDTELMQEKIKSSSKLVSQAIQDLRDLSRSLNADSVIELGLERSVESELELIKRAGKYETSLNWEGEPGSLSHRHELIIFRICQEVLNNTIKHAKASEINIRVAHTPENFIMQIADNGIGFNVEEIKKAKKDHGIGIINISNRASIIGATLKIDTDPGKGTCVVITLPVKK
ncbi:MAG: ATP-binding protein [Ginsengibacter sp.]